MEMQQVRYFLSVARTLNFTRAAEDCNVTQPALTRAIKQLEDELGGELIRREGRLSHLTDLGNRMAWFALGLVLSLGVVARRVPRLVPA